MILLLFSLLLTPAAFAKFDDAALQARLAESTKEKTRLVIYHWSPHMPLSVRGLEDLLATKGDRDYRVLALLGEDSGGKAAREVAKKKKWPDSVLERDESLALRRRGARVHYPSYDFVKDGAFVGNLVPGYREPASLKDLAKERF